MGRRASASLATCDSDLESRRTAPRTSRERIAWITASTPMVG